MEMNTPAIVNKSASENGAMKLTAKKNSSNNRLNENITVETMVFLL